MVVNHYLHGAAYPTGGAAELARRIIPTVTAGGGAVLVNANVQSVIVDETGAAAGVLLVMRGQDGPAVPTRCKAMSATHGHT